VTSQETVAVAVAALAAFNRRDLAAWSELVHPQCECAPPRDWPESATIHGSEEVWAFHLATTEPWQGMTAVPHEVIPVDADELAVAELRAEVRGKTSNVAVEWCYWIVATVRDGQVVRIAYFVTKDEALAHVA
jgi:ketosteroid isomerase-like protein